MQRREIERAQIDACISALHAAYVVRSQFVGADLSPVMQGICEALARTDRNLGVHADDICMYVADALSRAYMRKPFTKAERPAS